MRKPAGGGVLGVVAGDGTSALRLALPSGTHSRDLSGTCEGPHEGADSKQATTSALNGATEAPATHYLGKPRVLYGTPRDRPRNDTTPALSPRCR
eukprot:scaffold47451_cov140-Isochrysis_galbana.AAC.4